MKEIRILFTGVGRRVELMQAFRSAAFHTGCRLRLYGADMTFTAPALFYCDAMRQVCSMRDTDYIPELVRICQDDSIDLVIPTIDTDLLILSEHTADFAAAGTRVLISRPEMIRICRDKNYTSEFFVSCGLRAPMPVNDWREYRGKFPCFIKPKDGSSSINAFRVENPEELAVYAAEIGDYIVQPFVEGTEYTIDMFGDFDGNLISAVPRIRLWSARENTLTKICLDPVILGEPRVPAGWPHFGHSSGTAPPGRITILRSTCGMAAPAVDEPRPSAESLSLLPSFSSPLPFPASPPAPHAPFFAFPFPRPSSRRRLGRPELRFRPLSFPPPPLCFSPFPLRPTSVRSQVPFHPRGAPLKCLFAFRSSLPHLFSSGGCCRRRRWYMWETTWRRISRHRIS